MKFKGVFGIIPTLIGFPSYFIMGMSLIILSLISGGSSILFKPGTFPIPRPTTFGIIIVILLTALILFGIGALIGWMVGKRKARKEE